MGMAPYEALVTATRSRVVPVAVASGTTILGMLPLLFDVFERSSFGVFSHVLPEAALLFCLETGLMLSLIHI